VRTSAIKGGVAARVMGATVYHVRVDLQVEVLVAEHEAVQVAAE